MIENISATIRSRKLTYLSAEKFESLYACLNAVQDERVDGDFLEFGVALGGSGICLAKALGAARRYLGYDVFGMIPPPSEVDGHAVIERYNTIASGKSAGIGGDPYYGYVPNLYEVVKANFASFGCPVDGFRVQLIQGLFEETFPTQTTAAVALAHIDCDWYEPVSYCLRHVWPRLAPGGFIVLDDYGDWEGCRKATDEFVAEHGLPLLRAQPHAVIRKNSAS